MALGDRMVAEPFERKVMCKNCGKTYRQIVEDQAAGFRMLSEDECPYCGNISKKSMSQEYTNFKLEDL